MRAEQRQNPLHQGNAKRNNQGQQAQLRYHGVHKSA